MPSAFDLTEARAAAQNAHTGHVRRWMCPTGGRILLQRPVRPVAVVVIGVLAEDQPQVAFAEDRHVVQALAAKCAHEPLSVTSSKTIVNLQSRSRIKNLNLLAR